MRAAQDVDVLSGGEETSSGDGVGTARWGLPLALVAAVAVVAADRLTKLWAESRLVDGPCRPGGDGCIDLILGVRLHLVYNRGAAFSAGPRLGPLYAVIALVMAAFLLNLARSRRGHGAALLGLIAGGAIGNLVDRIVRAEDGLLSGAVIDFIDLQWWPVFNVADAAVVIGVAAIALQSIVGSGGDEPAGSDASEPAGEEESAASEALA